MVVTRDFLSSARASSSCSNNPFLRAAEPYVRYHWPPVRGRLLQTALVARGIKLRPPEKSRAPRKTLKKVPVQVLSRYAPSLQVSRLGVTVRTACGPSLASGNAKIPLKVVTLPVRESLLNAGNNPQLPAPSAARSCSTSSSRLQRLNTAWRQLQLVPQSCQFPGRRSSVEKTLGATSPGPTPAVLRSGSRPLHYPTYWLWIEADLRTWSLCGRVGPLEPAGSMRENRLQWKRSVTCNGTRALAPTPSYPARIAPKSLLNPVRVLRAAIICHSVVIVILFPHVTGGPIKNIAAAPCHPAVGSDVTDLTSICHCPECDPSPRDS